MLYVDSLILNAVERACRRIQRATGRTNVWLALQLTNLSIVMYFLWAGVAFWNTEVALRVFVALFCGALLYVLIQTLFRDSIEAIEASAFRRVAKGIRNPRRVRDALLRVSFLWFSIVFWMPLVLVDLRVHGQLLLLTYSLIVLTTAVLYLVACDPLPPAAEEQRERARAAEPVPAVE